MLYGQKEQEPCLDNDYKVMRVACLPAMWYSITKADNYSNQDGMRYACPPENIAPTLISVSSEQDDEDGCEGSPMDIQWYPGHMAKAKRQLAEKLKLINVAVVVTDARAPRSTMNPDLWAMLSGKPCVVVLNKRDLADETLTARWTEKFAEHGAVLAFSATQDKPGALKAAIDRAAAPVVKKYAAKGMNKTVRVLVAGTPNVGKSALINRLIGRKSAKEGDKPGVTRGLQWVKLSSTVELLDSPGLLWPKIDTQETAAKIALCGSLKQEIIDLTELALHLIRLIKDIAPQALASRYGVEVGEAYETLSAICGKRGFLLRGGEPDIERGAQMLLNEFKGGKLGRITLESPEDD